MCGFVVLVAPRLALIHRLSSDIDLDGYAVVRRRNVTRVEMRPRYGSFYQRALGLRGQRARVPGGMDLGDMGAAISSAGRLFPLLTLYREDSRRGECAVGQVRTLAEKTVTLRWLTPGAKWDGLSPAYRLADITLLGFGGRYEDALARVAGLRRPAMIPGKS